jgi:hypothetical protein
MVGAHRLEHGGLAMSIVSVTRHFIGSSIRCLGTLEAGRLGGIDGPSP